TCLRGTQKGARRTNPPWHCQGKLLQSRELVARGRVRLGSRGVSRENLFAAFFFAVFVFLIYQLGIFLAPFWGPLVWATILALTFYPLTSWLTALLRGNRTLASLLLVGVVIAVVVLPSIYLGSLIIDQSTAAYERVQQMAHDGELTQIVEQVRT